MTWTTPPPGWEPFGFHADSPDLRLEFSEEEGEDGLPLWERPAREPEEAPGEEP